MELIDMIVADVLAPNMYQVTTQYSVSMNA